MLVEPGVPVNGTGRCCPDAAEEAHAGGGDAVAGEEPEDRGGELERHGEREHTESDLFAFGRCDPAELESRHDERCGGEAEEPERERACDRAQDDARAPGELLPRGLSAASRSSDHERLRCARLDPGQEPVGLRLGLGLAAVATSFSSPSRAALAACAPSSRSPRRVCDQVERAEIFEQRLAVPGERLPVGRAVVALPSGSSVCPPCRPRLRR